MTYAIMNPITRELFQFGYIGEHHKAELEIRAVGLSLRDKVCYSVVEICQECRVRPIEIVVVKFGGDRRICMECHG